MTVAEPEMFAVCIIPDEEAMTWGFAKSPGGTWLHGWAPWHADFEEVE